METALTPISAMIDSRQIIYHAKRSKPNNDAINQKKDTWDKQVRSAMSKYKINPADLEGKSNRKKERNKIKAKIDTFTHNEIMEASSTKSKVKHLIDNEGYKKGIQQRHTYMTERNRNKCSAIFATRTRMLGVKNNYRTEHDDLLWPQKVSGPSIFYYIYSKISIKQRRT